MYASIRRIAATLVIFLMGAAVPVRAAEVSDPFANIIGRITQGGARQDLFDLIEKGEVERAKQDAARAAREAETRDILVDIREKIFRIRLNIAAIEGGKPACDARSRQLPGLAAQIEDLDRLAMSARRICDEARPSGAGVAALCKGRLDEITAERGAVERERTAAGACGDAQIGSARP